MNAVGKASTLILLVLLAWCAAHWTELQLAWRYRAELRAAAAAAENLEVLGVTL